MNKNPKHSETKYQFPIVFPKQPFRGNELKAAPFLFYSRRPITWKVALLLFWIFPLLSREEKVVAGSLEGSPRGKASFLINTFFLGVISKKTSHTP